MSVKYLIVNGSRKGLCKNLRLRYQENVRYFFDINEKSLVHIRNKYPNVRAVYLYVPEDVKDKTIHDIGPTIALYNRFIKIDKQ